LILLLKKQTAQKNDDNNKLFISKLRYISHLGEQAKHYPPNKERKESKNIFYEIERKREKY
jgi:hypothetical protein